MTNAQRRFQATAAVRALSLKIGIELSLGGKSKDSFQRTYRFTVYGFTPPKRFNSYAEIEMFVKRYAE